MGVCSGGGGGFTRADCHFVEHVLNNMLTTLIDAVTSAFAEIQQEKMDHARKALCKLTDVERRRRFLEDGGLEPEDEAMKYCPVCKCKGTVDIPSSNSVKARRNEEKLSLYKK